MEVQIDLSVIIMTYGGSNREEFLRKTIQYALMQKSSSQIKMEVIGNRSFT